MPTNKNINSNNNNLEIESVSDSDNYSSNHSDNTHELSFQEQFLLNNDKLNRKKEGQFFTPPSCANKILDMIFQQKESKHLFKNNNIPLSVIEPSVGTGVFINSWLNFLKDKKIKRKYLLKCIELNQSLFQHIKDTYQSKNINIITIKDNFLLTPTLDNESCHLIIGNPPYFELKKENKTPYLEFYGEIMRGRPNIYALFIYKCVLLLKNSGICGLILSPSFFNGSYFSELRHWMYDKIHILKIEKIESMKDWDTNVPLIYFVFQKKPSTTNSRDRYWFKKKNHLIISINYNYLNIKFPNPDSNGNYNTLDSLNTNQNNKHFKSISDLGCQVSTGNIVWNQIKDKLVSQSKNSKNNKLNHIIIYSHNLLENRIEIFNDVNESNTKSNQKKQYYINEFCQTSTQEPNDNEENQEENPSDNFTGLIAPVILVNRVMGSHNKKIKSVLVTDKILKLPGLKGRLVAAENHLNVIHVLGNKSYKEKEKMLKHIYQSLIQIPSKYLNSISGNSQISSNELAHLIPIKSI